ncbi:Ltp family lipoprotein [Mobilicoccus pelagius]|uniref:Putative host cell surface-exposed lipoprotein Ltp-like HTH region domain-containing protein n=1 Tax=Mobilicoccus pelagius NBRC 104925 TaxID=1089455 RepID=H5URI3_9MICO|nr:Ltp family lipoprotein [Mobilicoccus pelagius]GAB48341.1 hypothetical protein MOPEL_071_00570 [Mobilicoccus pelagius NBRC 104925]
MKHLLNAALAMGLGAAVVIAPTAQAQAAGPAPSALSQAVSSENSRAIARAQSYLRFTAFSKSGLVHQLEFEGFSHAASAYASRHVKVGWRAQAVRMGKQYLAYDSFSSSGLRDQLVFEGFTRDEADYAIRHLFPKRTPSTPKPSSSRPGKDLGRTGYSAKFDLCSEVSGSGVTTLVTKGTTCVFGSTVLDKYAALVDKNPKKYMRSATFTARSTATKKTYPVRCSGRYTRAGNGWRYRELNCSSGQGYRAKMQLIIRMY